MKAVLRRILHFLFGFYATNLEVFKTPGPVILLPNHVSWFDWLFLLACSDGDWKCVVSRRTAHTSWLHRLIMLNRFTFPIDTDSPYAMKQMAAFLSRGGRLVLFPEGRLSRTGTLMRLFEGTGFLLHKTDAKVITCYLRGSNTLPASPNPNVKQWFPNITAHFSEVLTPPKVTGLSAMQARLFYTNWLRDTIVTQRFEVEMQVGPKSLVEAFVETAKRYSSRVAMEDIIDKLTYKEILVGTQLMTNQLEKTLSANNPRVGVLLPNVNAVAVVLLSLWNLGRQAAMLNYSTGTAAVLSCIQLSQINQVITSRVFLERAKLDINALSGNGVEFIFLEDLKSQITGFSKIVALLKQTFSPGFSVPDFGKKSSESQSEETAVVLFTSGSEGVPKGVQLSHRNILANIRQMLAVTDLTDEDRAFNAMPVFHSFGLTVGLLLPLLRGLYVFIYPSPLHYRVVPTAFYNVDATIMIGTNTFLNGYARKAHPYDFRSLRTMFSAAEKLQESTTRVWADRFGVRILEGYGATECSPCVSLNTPLQAKPGSAGRLMPGMEYRLEPVEGVSEGGRLFVRGPNVMKGYLKLNNHSTPEENNGWYDTGDVVRIDSEGFVFIQGRLKRFAKISGEMVSLTAVEDAMAGAFPQYGLRCQTAVVALQDGDKGERLVVITNEPKLNLEEIRNAIRAKNLPNLAVPREVKSVSEIPKLGTGKVNYRELEKALQLA